MSRGLGDVYKRQTDTGNENVKKYMGENPDDYNEDLDENGYSGINEENELEALNMDYSDDYDVEDGSFDDGFGDDEF